MKFLLVSYIKHFFRKRIKGVPSNPEKIPLPESMQKRINQMKKQEN